jgi:hypothetical protein
VLGVRDVLAIAVRDARGLLRIQSPEGGARGSHTCSYMVAGRSRKDSVEKDMSNEVQEIVRWKIQGACNVGCDMSSGIAFVCEIVVVNMVRTSGLVKGAEHRLMWIWLDEGQWEARARGMLRKLGLRWTEKADRNRCSFVCQSGCW